MKGSRTQRRLSGVDEVVLSLYAKGLTTGEISAHFTEIYGASVSKETISRITDKVLEEMQDWAVRPLDETYAAVFIDAIVVKVRDGQVANRPFYAAIGVTLAGERDILGLCARNRAMSSRSPNDKYRPDTVAGSPGFTPPACRNHRNPTGDDTPAAAAASSVVTPPLIAAQNLTRSSRHATVGRPGDGICPRYPRTCFCRGPKPIASPH